MQSGIQNSDSASNEGRSPVLSANLLTISAPCQDWDAAPRWDCCVWCFQLPLPFLSSSMGSSSPICAAGGLLCPVLVEQQSGTATLPRSISEGIWIVLATAVSQRLPSLQAPAACAHWVQPAGKTSPHWGCRWIAVVLIAGIKTRKMEGNTQASRHR